MARTLYIRKKDCQKCGSSDFAWKNGKAVCSRCSQAWNPTFD